MKFGLKKMTAVLSLWALVFLAIHTQTHLDQSNQGSQHACSVCRLHVEHASDPSPDFQPTFHFVQKIIPGQTLTHDLSFLATISSRGPPIIIL